MKFSPLIILTFICLCNSVLSTFLGLYFNNELIVSCGGTLTSLIALAFVILQANFELRDLTAHSKNLVDLKKYSSPLSALEVRLAAKKNTVQAEKKRRYYIYMVASATFCVALGQAQEGFAFLII